MSKVSKTSESLPEIIEFPKTSDQKTQRVKSESPQSSQMNNTALPPMQYPKLELMRRHLRVQTGENYTGPSASELYQEYIITRGKRKPDLKKVVKKSTWSAKTPILLPLLPLILLKVLFVGLLTEVTKILSPKREDEEL